MTLPEILAELGIEASAPQRETLLRYLDLLAHWNETYNLTSVRDRESMLTHHLADCLAVVGPLQRTSCAAPRVLDVGSGGGLPGAVIATMLPDWKVTCIDAVGKKAAFVRQVAGELGLQNLLAVHGRVEAARNARFEIVTARAFASLADFVALTRPLLAPQGVWMAMKGRAPDAEIEALPADVEVFHVERIAVPGLAAERCLVWMRLISS